MEKYVLLNVVISLMIERYASCFHSASCCFCFSAFSFELSAVIRSSIIAAVCQNAGQLAAAAVLTGTGAVLGYAPALLIFSLITGAVTGTVLRIVMPALEKQTRFIIKK